MLITIGAVGVLAATIERLAVLLSLTADRTLLLGEVAAVVLAAGLLAATNERRVDGSATGDGEREAATFVTAGATCLGLLGLLGLNRLLRIEVAAGIGRLELALGLAVAVTLAALVIAWTVATGWPRPRARVAGPWIAAAALAGTMALLVAAFLRVHVALGWDESVYALAARSWLYETPSNGWVAYRPPGLSVLLMPLLLLGDHESLLRLVGLGSGVAAVLVTWRLGVLVGGAATGLLSGALVLSVPQIQVHASFLLNDIPAAALLLLLMVVLWRQLEREGPPTGWFLLTAPIAAAAFYLRYGSAVAIACLGVVALLLWHRTLLRHWQMAVATVTLFGVLVAPHLVFATLTTGSPIGLLTSATEVLIPAYPGEALVRYVEWFPRRLAGPLAAGFMTLGLVGWAWYLLRGRRRDHDAVGRALTLLVVPAMLQVVVIGFISHPEGRYIFLPIILLLVAGALVASRGWRALDSRHRAVVAAAALALLAGIVLDVGAANVRLLRAQLPREHTVLASAEALRDASHGECSVLTNLVPQVTWYSGCAAYNFADTRVPGRERVLHGQDRFLLVLVNDDPAQPRGDVLEAYLAKVEEDPVTVIRDAGGTITARLYRFPD